MSRFEWRTGSGVLLILLLLIGVLPAQALPAADADHLLLSEAVVDVHPSEIGTVTKYIEIVNPTTTEIDLSGVYLTNATLFPTTAYWEIVLLDGSGGGGTSAKFHCRFPDGATLADGDTLVVAIQGSEEYETAFGRAPHFELYEDGIAPDSVAEMVEVFPGSIGFGLGSDNSNQPPNLTGNTGSVILYLWDGMTDLVGDFDYLHWGNSTNVRFDKTDVVIDGPDADSDSTAYLPDTPFNSQTPIATDQFYFGKSFQRISADEGAEVNSGGNGVGVDGHDESSEPLDATWAVVDGRDPPTAPLAPQSPAPIFDDVATSPAIPRDGQQVSVTATLLALTTVAGATLYYSVDGGAFTDVAASNNGDGSWSAVILEQAEDSVVSWYFTTVGQEGGTAVYPSGAPAYTVSYTVQASGPPPTGDAVHLLLTEVCAQPTSGEFIEIHNSSATDTVDLSVYYLTDAIHVPANQFYWRIVEPVLSQANVGGGAFFDFHARFPDGAVIAPGDTITVSVAGSDAFASTYGFLPTFELYEDGTAQDDVPDMEPVWENGPADNSIVGVTTPTLTNAGEIMVLYYWNGQTNLVTDVDVFFWGTNTSYRFSKTGVVIDNGPEPGSSAYLSETSVGNQNPYSTETDFGDSYQRRGDEGDEIDSGSNGVDGHDEVSEDLPVTWQIAAASPARPTIPGGGGGSQVALEVPARTFLPLMGEAFPIRFTSKPRSETRLRIFDLEGRLVMQLFDSRFDGPPSVIAGQFTRRDWDGRDEMFELVPAGMYVVHLAVVDKETGKEETKQAPVVVATRLSK